MGEPLDILQRMGGYRLVDPNTSKQAYEQMVANGSVSRRRMEILGWMCSRPDRTAGQIAQGVGGIRNNVATRLSELEAMNVVEKVREMPCPVSGKSCWTWQMTGLQPTNIPSTSASASPSKATFRVAVAELQKLWKVAKDNGTPFSDELIEVCHWLKTKARSKQSGNH